MLIWLLIEILPFVGIVDHRRTIQIIDSPLGWLSSSQ